MRVKETGDDMIMGSFCFREKKKELVFRNTSPWGKGKVALLCFVLSEGIFSSLCAKLIRRDYLTARRGNETAKTLFLKRKDKELGKTVFVAEDLPGIVEVHDWPSIEHRTFCQKMFGGVSLCRQMTGKYVVLHFLRRLFCRFEDLYATVY